MSYLDRARPAVTVDMVVLTAGASPRVLLIKRQKAPFEARWALPGGYVEQDEPVMVAARRELQEETGVEVDSVRFLGLYDEPGRDPRGWTISAAHVATVPHELTAAGADDAADARWFDVAALPELAFDHAAIIRDALGSSQD